MFLATSPIEESRFVRTALWASMITSDQLVDCVDEQITCAMDGGDIPSLPEMLVAKGKLRRDQAEAIRGAMNTHVRRQRRDQFGQLALRQGYIGSKQLRDCLDHQAALLLGSDPVPILGHILIEHGYMTDDQVLEVLRTQQRARRGALYDLHTALCPIRKRVARMLRKHRGALAVAVVVMGTVIAGVAATRLHAIVSAPARIHLVCGQCGGEAWLDASRIAQPCTKCGKGTMFAALRCAKCRLTFPLKAHASAGGVPWIEPCPTCGSLRHVALPPGLEALRTRTKTMSGTLARAPLDRAHSTTAYATKDP